MEIKFLKGNTPLPPQADEVSVLSKALAPALTRLGVLLVSGNLTEWVMEVMNDKRMAVGRFVWQQHNSPVNRNPNHLKLSAEIFNILEHSYPSSTSLLMGGVISPNKILSEQIASIVAEVREQDRQDLEAELQNIVSKFRENTL